MEPTNAKYRWIKTSNKVIKQKLVGLHDIENALCEIGCTKDNDFVHALYVLIATAYVIEVPDTKRTNDVSDTIETLKGTPTTSTGAVSKPTAKSKRPSTILGQQPYREKNNFAKVLQTSDQHLKFIEHISESFSQYEDKALQKLTLKYIIRTNMSEGYVFELSDIEIQLKQFAQYCYSVTRCRTGARKPQTVRHSPEILLGKITQ